MHTLPQVASEPLSSNFPASRASIGLESPSLAALPLAPVLCLGTCPEAASLPPLPNPSHALLHQTVAFNGKFKANSEIYLLL